MAASSSGGESAICLRWRKRRVYCPGVDFSFGFWGNEGVMEMEEDRRPCERVIRQRMTRVNRAIKDHKTLFGRCGRSLSRNRHGRAFVDVELKDGRCRPGVSGI